jgi:hypothetical protein
MVVTQTNQTNRKRKSPSIDREEGQVPLFIRPDQRMNKRQPLAPTNELSVVGKSLVQFPSGFDYGNEQSRSDKSIPEGMVVRQTNQTNRKGKSPSFDREEGQVPVFTRPDQRMNERQPLAPTNELSVVGKSSVQFPPSLDRTRALQPNRQILNREIPSLFEDFSMESKLLLGMLGMPPTG